jgi:ribosome-associated protein
VTHREAFLEAVVLARLIIDLIADKKGENIILMDLRNLSPITDYFVIGSATNERQLNAVTEHVRDEVKKREQLYPWRIEGQGSDGWVLMDYGDVVVHLFVPEVRSYYDLEGLWHDANVLLHVQ